MKVLSLAFEVVVLSFLVILVGFGIALKDEFVVVLERIGIAMASELADLLIGKRARLVLDTPELVHCSLAMSCKMLGHDNSFLTNFDFVFFLFEVCLTTNAKDAIDACAEQVKRARAWRSNSRPTL